LFLSETVASNLDERVSVEPANGGRGGGGDGQRRREEGGGGRGTCEFNLICFFNLFFSATDFKVFPDSL
jgi:hypothetical protein